MTNIFGGYNILTSFNAIIPNVSTLLLNLPDRKASDSHDFPEKNGIVIDLDQPTFSARSFPFVFVFSGDTVEDVKDNFLAFFTICKQPGVKQFYNDFVNMSVYIYYVNQNGMQPMYKNSEGGWSLQCTINFSETDPDLNLPNVYLVDDQNRFLVP